MYFRLIQQASYQIQLSNLVLENFYVQILLKVNYFLIGLSESSYIQADQTPKNFLKRVLNYQHLSILVNIMSSTLAKPPDYVLLNFHFLWENTFQAKEIILGFIIAICNFIRCSLQKSLHHRKHAKNGGNPQNFSSANIQCFFGKLALIANVLFHH